MSINGTTDRDIIRDLIKEQKSLKKRRYFLNSQIQDLYNRWERNGLNVTERGGARYIPLAAVRPLSRLISKLGKVERRLQTNRSLIKILTEINRREDEKVHSGTDPAGRA